MSDWLARYLSPSQRGKVHMVVAIVVIFVGAVAVMEMLEPKQKQRDRQKEVTSLITTQKGREFGLDAVSGKVQGMEKQQQETEQKLERLLDENKKLKASAKHAAALSREVQSATQSIQALKEQMARNERETQQRIKEAVDKIQSNQVEALVNRNTKTASTTSTLLPSKRKGTHKRPCQTGFHFSYGGKNGECEPNNGGTETAHPATSTTSSNSATQSKSDSTGRNAELFTIIETPQSETQDDSEAIYLPRGAILTGVLITGLDAPTSSSASENPIPVLVRLKKEAILPNFAVLEEVRECFAIVSGYGDLSTERANFRGESITCVRNDGGVIEAAFGGFAVGEDGKNGLKGTLVTRNSSVLANAMMAGFASGLSSMFDVNPVPVIATDSTGTQQYDSVFNSAAVKGGAAKGASNAMEKLADYYMTLADAMHPVIEIGAGRVVDMVVTKGTTL